VADGTQSGRTDPGDGLADDGQRRDRRSAAAPLYPLGQRSRAGRAGDQRRHRRRPAPDASREGARGRDRRRRTERQAADRGPFTRQAVEQARDFKAAGAGAFLVFPISAYLSAPLNPEVPVRYHQAIAEVGLPLILFQLQPALGGVNFDPETLRALASIDGVVAIKEASFDARRFLDLVRVLEELPRPITLLTGNDNFIFESFVLGAQGALIGFGAIMTREQVRMIDAWRAGGIDEAKELGRRVQRLADVVFAAPVGDYRARMKEALAILGVIDTTYVREPLLPISDEQRNLLRRTLAEVGLLEMATV
jgi:4-hydroxy-tetrahydrodipicolinate synthase